MVIIMPSNGHMSCQDSTNRFGTRQMCFCLTQDNELCAVPSLSRLTSLPLPSITGLSEGAASECFLIKVTKQNKNTKTFSSKAFAPKLAHDVEVYLEMITVFY